MCVHSRITDRRNAIIDRRNAAQEYPRLLSVTQAGLAGHPTTALPYGNSELTHLNSKERENEAAEKAEVDMRYLAGSGDQSLFSHSHLKFRAND
jgi:hypothetical protein